MTHPLAAAPAVGGHVLALPAVLHATPVTPTSFGHDAWWVIIAKVLVVFGLLVGITLITIWGERRIVARMQQRLGPNRVGPFGVTQGLADGIKLMLKEDLIPALADKPVFLLAPILSAIPAFLAFSVVPFGPNVSVAGHHTPLQLTDLPVGLLFLLACSSLGVYGIVLAGWSSGSTYPLLGALRSAAQMISYEISMGLSFVPVLLYSGSLSTSAIVASQQGRWYAWVLPISFGVYVISAVGETNRAPFDLPEAETELVGGFHTEYSSIKFALFFLAEYINMVTVSAVATTLFLGGWRAPWPISLVGAFNTGWWPLLWFLGKVVVFLFGFIWLRGTLPRLRYDQFMKLGWKVLIPLSLVWLLAVACIRTFQLHVAGSHRTPYIIAAVVIILAVMGLLLLDPGAGRRHREDERTAEDARRRAGDLTHIPLPPRQADEPEVISSAGERVGAGTTGRRSDL